MLTCINILRRVVWIIGVVCCIVVGGFAPESRAGMYRYHFLIIIKALPVEAPFRDVDETSSIATAIECPGFEGDSYLMHVRKNSQQGDIESVHLISLMESSHRICRNIQRTIGHSIEILKNSIHIY